MIWLVIILPLLALAVVAYLALTAPIGYEDEDGYHDGYEDS